MNTICFLMGIGFQELILLLIFLAFIIGIPVVVIVLMVRRAGKKKSEGWSSRDDNAGIS